jgi:hypothetical protein
MLTKKIWKWVRESRAVEGEWAKKEKKNLGERKQGGRRRGRDCSTYPLENIVRAAQ